MNELTSLFLSRFMIRVPVFARTNNTEIFCESWGLPRAVEDPYGETGQDRDVGVSKGTMNPTLGLVHQGGRFGVSSVSSVRYHWVLLLGPPTSTRNVSL